MKSALDTTLNTAHIPVEEYQKVCAKVDALQQQVDWFKRQLFGRKPEKHLVDNPDQAHLFALAFDEVLPPAPKKAMRAQINKKMIITSMIPVFVLPMKCPHKLLMYRAPSLKAMRRITMKLLALKKPIAWRNCRAVIRY